MKTITIQVPDNCEVQIIEKEEKKESIIRTYKELVQASHRVGVLPNIKGELKHAYAPIGQDCPILAKSMKVAKSMLAMAMISQLMPHYGGEVTNEEWANENIFKFSIIRIGNSISFLIQAKSIYSNYYYLTFHTDNMMRDFLKYNEQLVKDYLMID